MAGSGNPGLRAVCADWDYRCAGCRKATFHQSAMLGFQACSARQALLIIYQDKLMREGVSPFPEDDVDVGIGRAWSKASDDQTAKALVFQSPGKTLCGRFTEDVHVVSPGRGTERLSVNTMIMKQGAIVSIKQRCDVRIVGDESCGL